MTQKDLKYFFVERFHELLNRNSIDSYRVRCNNVFTLIRELRGVIDNWLRGYVKQFETVGLCIEETLDSLKNDNILDYSFYDKQLMLDDLKILAKADQKDRGEMGNRVIYLLDRCIFANQSVYIERLYDKIWTLIDNDDEIPEGEFKPLADQINKLSGALACELLSEGFSLRHLFRQSCKLKDNVNDFNTYFIRFRESHRHDTPLNTYEVVLKLNGGSNTRLTSINGFINEVPLELVPENKREGAIAKFLSSRGVLFYHCQVEAHDTAAAITFAEERLGSVIDRAMLGYSILDVKVQKMSLVIIKSTPEWVYVVQPVTIMDSSYADDAEVVNDMITKIDTILNNDNIALDVKDRLTSSLRHLRIGNIDTDTGQQLVNYWVALEFIFSSPKAIDSTIPRLEKNLLNVLMCCYANRRVRHLNDALIKNGTLEEGRFWWMLPEADLNVLITNQRSLLLRYHLQDMKANLWHSRDAADKFFKTHRRHLYWQIYRIYRYRNRLIHEAAIVPGLDNVIRCQRFYLVLLLNQLIGYFSRVLVQPLSMDSFFYEYAQKANFLNSIVKQNLTGEERISKLMKLEVYSELIRQNV